MAKQYQRKDSFYNKAKAEGQRCRAFYKIEEIDKKFKFFSRGMDVLDLGAWPGGWLQYAADKIGERGLAVGVDLAEIQKCPQANIRFYQGDVRDSEFLEMMFSETRDKFDVVMSDLSPKLTGIRDVDMCGAAELARTALNIAKKVLKTGGSFTCKVFMSPEAQDFVKEVQSVFKICKREEMESSRKSSSEFYVVGMGFKGNNI